MSRLAALLAAALLAPAAARAAPGETWEHTTEMKMKGVPFAIPATTMTFCKPTGKSWEEPPGPSDDADCKTTVTSRTASSLRWKMVCTGERKMEGEGEMSWTATSYAGTVDMRSPDGDMNVKMKGKRIGKPCDAEAQEREARELGERMEAQQATSAAMLCQSAVESMSASHFTGKPPLCADRVKKDELCERARTRQGLEALRARGDAELGVATRLCKLDVAKIEAGFCDAAVAEEDLDYVGASCPAQVKALAKRECAGRTYTDVRSSYRSFCTEYAADEMMKASAKQKATDGAVDQGKKVIRGLFGL